MFQVDVCASMASNWIKFVLILCKCFLDVPCQSLGPAGFIYFLVSVNVLCFLKVGRKKDLEVKMEENYLKFCLL